MKSLAKNLENYAEVTQASPTLATAAPFLTYHLRLITADLGEVYFVFGATKAYSATYDIVRTSRLCRPPEHDAYELATKKDLTSEPWSVRQDPMHTTSPAGSTGSRAVADIARHWLTRCLDDHTLCGGGDKSRATDWYPKRLLQIDLGNGGLRLISTTNKAPLGPYATLSHCWGSKPICILTADNIADYMATLPWHTLTKTFQDAVVTARRLGIRYIWIDSLCILQAGDGSDQDWREHATAIRSVYSRSVLNISVARAWSGEEGAFIARDPSAVTACHVWWEVEHHPQAVELAESFWTIRRATQHASAAIRTAPLYTRGWVVQERYLAPRVLHFGSDRIFWECNEEPWIDESFPAGFSHCPDYEPVVSWPFHSSDVVGIRSGSGPGLGFSEMTSSRALWHDTIDTYTSCDLTLPDKDILVALAGIAERFGRAYDHRYAAGLFQVHLPYDLLWRHRGERAVTWRAPTWSWASIDGAIEMSPAAGGTSYDANCQTYTEVRSVHVDLVDPQNVYGQLRSAKIYLRGYVIPCGIAKAESYGTGRLQPIALAIDQQANDVPSNDVQKVYGEAYIDTEEDSLRGYTSMAKYEAWCLPIFDSTSSNRTQRERPLHEHRGLILKFGGQGEYVRMGTYILGQRFMPDTIDGGRLTQDICLV
nr:hypothetical protein B0A51_08842 [Rachicladosporium sp. CCFEE 5018]